MNSEAKFKPTGHRRPGHRPRQYEQAEFTELELLFNRWQREVEDIKSYGLDRLDKLYDGADHLVRPIFKEHYYSKNEEPPYTLSDVDELIRKCRDFKDVGIFASILLNYIPEEEIVLDFDFPINHLGYRFLDRRMFIGTPCIALKRNGMLINNGVVGDGFGRSGDGGIINYGIAGNDMGDASNGVVINFGEAERDLACGRGGVVANYGMAGARMHTIGGYAFNFGEVDGNASEFWGYFINCGVIKKTLKKAGGGGGVLVNLTPSTDIHFPSGDTCLRIETKEQCEKVPGLLEEIYNVKERLSEQKYKQTIWDNIAENGFLATYSPEGRKCGLKNKLNELFDAAREVLKLDGGTRVE